jgi:hypothetical protein
LNEESNPRLEQNVVEHHTKMCRRGVAREWGFRGWREGGKEIFGQFMCDKHTNGYRDSFELPTADTTQPTTMKVFASNVEVTDRSSTGRYQVKSVRRHGKLDVEDSRENGALGVQEGNERKL